MLANRLLRLVVLFSLLLVAACDEIKGKKGEQCSRCSGDGDCTGSRLCFLFSDGTSRCAQSRGNTCSTILSVAEPTSTALSPRGHGSPPPL